LFTEVTRGDRLGVLALAGGDAVNDEATPDSSEEGGQPSLPDALFVQFYEELRMAARRFMRDERNEHTLQPTALVNEAFIRLRASSDIDLQDRVHFLRLAARTMRHVLVDHARRKRTRRRGGDRVRVTLTDGKQILEPEFDLLDLDRALSRLSEESDRQASIIELRFFMGLSVEEVVAELDLSDRTIKSETRFALAWLLRELDA
jgi:RNA polymerase sigma factor (TIGR02999 family)